MFVQCRDNQPTVSITLGATFNIVNDDSFAALSAVVTIGITIAADAPAAALDDVPPPLLESLVRKKSMYFLLLEKHMVAFETMSAASFLASPSEPPVLMSLRVFSYTASDNISGFEMF